MTATVTGRHDGGQVPGDQQGQPSRPPAARGTRRARRATLSTPSSLRALLTALVLLSLAWGAFAGWAAIQHSSAADAVVTTDEGASQEATLMYEAISDADATITASYLKSPEPQLTALQRYAADIQTAASNLAKLEAAGGDNATTTALAAIGPGLNTYSGDVADAKTEFAMGYTLTGGSFLQVASEEAHLVLLPAANTVFMHENATLTAASGQATELPTLIGAIVAAIIVGVVLFRAQRWLTRRTNRMFSVGLVLASALLVVSTVWLTVGFFAARADLNRGIGHGSAPAQTLDLAAIGVQQIRGDAVLNVISRSGNTTFVNDFDKTSAQVGPRTASASAASASAASPSAAGAPGGGTLLDSAAAAQLPGSAGAADVKVAKRDATAWYAANADVYKLDDASDYLAEKESVVGTTPSSAGGLYFVLEKNIRAASDADQEVFNSAATSGAHTLDPLAGVVIAAAILMALASAWAITRRLAEYR
jgi:hypothetical protein